MFLKKNWLTHALQHNVEQIVSADELEQRLRKKKQLRIKFGVDVTNPLLHLGHGVNLWKMREFQEQGHKVVFLIGDFTSLIGDPTGRDKKRPERSAAEIEKDAQEYIRQVTMILMDDPAVFEVRRNSEWYSKMQLGDFLKICGKITHARLIERDMFQRRISDGKEIFMHELLYPVLQGYDSFALESDLTVVGTDQLFNELMGRHYQEAFGQAPQIVMTTVTTPGIDGGEKQSKSLGNFIGLLDSPQEKFGKVMSLPDELIMVYYQVYAFVEDAKLTTAEADLKAGKNPRDIKVQLAKDIIRLYHSAEAADQAEQEFNRIFREKEAPDTVMSYRPAQNPIQWLDFLVESDLAPSKTEARRLMQQGGVKLNKKVVETWENKQKFEDGDLIQVGKRRFRRIELN